MEDPSNDFDSVQWRRDDSQPESPVQSPPAKLKSNGKRRQSSNNPEPQLPNPNSDSVDNAGIGKDGFLDCTVDRPQKENDGTTNAYVSYLLTTHVSECQSDPLFQD